MTPERPAVRILVAVGLVAGCTLALQVLLTRLLSAVLFYHFGFLAISLALLGAGSGAIAVYVRPGWFERRSLEAVLARWTVVFAALLVIVPALLVRLDFEFTGKVTASFTVTMALTCLLAALPFTAAGIVIALAIREYTRWAGRVYGADLAGAGLGALLVVPMLRITDPATLMVALGAVAAVAALLFAASLARERLLGGGVAIAACAMVAIAASTSLYFLEPWTHVKPFAERWTPLSRVIAYPPKPGSDIALLFYDRVYAPVPVHKPNTPYPDAEKLSVKPQRIGYEMTGPGHALVIGGGGGRDIYNALSAGQEKVDVIELNQGIVDTVDKDLAEWSGSPYSEERVNTEVGDGRSLLAARDTQYDQIHIGFTDTLSANSATAFALTENNLYTVEAFDEYFDHLKPGGVLNVSRLYKLVGDEALRATVLTLETLEQRGVGNPERNVVVILGRDILGELSGTVLAREEPWSAQELQRMRRLVDERDLEVAYAPGGPYSREWADLARAESHEEFCSGYELDICASTDDRPFFFNQKRLEDFGKAPPPGYIYSIDPFLVLVITLGILLVLAAVAFVLPLFLVRREGRPGVGSLGFFAAIGLGFLLLEIVLIQRFVLFLGFPTYALSVVLFSLLVFTGLGALLSGRFRDDPRRALLVSLAGVSLLIAISAFALPPLLRELIELPFAARVAVTVALLAPLGVGMGMAMPIGLRRLQALHPIGVPWAWGINGITSVVASVLGIAVAITLGFTEATLLAALCYVGALAHAAFGRWPVSETGGDAPPRSPDRAGRGDPEPQPLAPGPAPG